MGQGTVQPWQQEWACWAAGTSHLFYKSLSHTHRNKQNISPQTCQLWERLCFQALLESGAEKLILSLREQQCPSRGSFSPHSQGCVQLESTEISYSSQLALKIPTDFSGSWCRWDLSSEWGLSPGVSVPRALQKRHFCPGWDFSLFPHFLSALAMELLQGIPPQSFVVPRRAQAWASSVDQGGFVSSGGSLLSTGSGCRRDTSPTSCSPAPALGH